MTINRCMGCKIGSSFCVYAKTVGMKNSFGKEQFEVPAHGCILGNEDEYAIWPDTEAWDIGLDEPLLVKRECEYRHPDSLDPFNSQLYLWENMSTNITTGDTFELPETPHGGQRRFEYEHPLYHIIDYNVPNNKSGLVRLTENCHVMGKDNLFLVSKGWEEDDFGEAKKAIGIPQVRYCTGLYGTRNKATGLIEHKSMKDWTSKVHTFKNFTAVKVSKYGVSKYNLFIDSFSEIDKFCREKIVNALVRKRLYEAFKLIMCGQYINVYQLLINNGLRADTARVVSNTISTKNPKSIYKNNEGHRYNIRKVETLYFNIINGNLPVKYGKKEILANIVNFILNDKDLMNHTIGETKNHDVYVKWYNENVNLLDEDMADELHPDRNAFNEYSSDNSLRSAINVIIDAIVVQKLLKVENLPAEFKRMYQHHKEYLEKFVAPRDIHEIGAAVLDVKEFLDPKDDNAYNSFKKIVRHFDFVSPIDLRNIWVEYEKAWKENTPSSFWDFVESEALSFNSACQIIESLYTGEDEFDIIDIEPSHGPYIRIRQKRYYNKSNQDREHMKLFDPDMDNAGYEVEEMFDVEVK